MFTECSGPSKHRWMFQITSLAFARSCIFYTCRICKCNMYRIRRIIGRFIIIIIISLHVANIPNQNHITDVRYTFGPHIEYYEGHIVTRSLFLLSVLRCSITLQRYHMIVFTQSRGKVSIEKTNMKKRKSQNREKKPQNVYR